MPVEPVTEIVKTGSFDNVNVRANRTGQTSS